MAHVWLLLLRSKGDLCALSGTQRAKTLHFGIMLLSVLPQQTCEPSFPNSILVVISKQGVGFMDPETKVGPVTTGSGTSGCGGVCKMPDPTTLLMVQEELDMYPFSRITDYHSRDERFHMALKTVRKGSNFVCETAHVSDRKKQTKKDFYS